MADANSHLDTSVANLSPETAALEEVIQKAVRYGALNLRVAIPCRIIAVQADQTVALQPLFMTRFKGQMPQAMAPLHDVPVVMPQGQDFRVTYPVAVGDLGLALFCDRNLDAFLASDGTTPKDPQDDRNHDLSDAVFFPGLVPQTLQTKDVLPSGDMVLQNGQLTLRLQKSGRLSVHNGTQEVVDLLDQLLQAQIDLIQDLSAALVLTSFGPAGFIANSVQAFGAIGTRLSALKTNLDTFKSQGST